MQLHLYAGAPPAIMLAITLVGYFHILNAQMFDTYTNSPKCNTPLHDICNYST